METVIEGSSAQLTVTFYNASGAAAAPNSATFKVTDLDTEATTQVSASITPIASSVIVDLTPAANTLVNQGLRHETRVVTVIASYGVSDQIVSEYRYRVSNSRI